MNFLLQSVLITGLTTAPAVASVGEDKNIVATAVEAGSFETLAAALGAADLAGVLQGEGPFTVFAPTDAAFGKLPRGTVETLLKPENKAELASILTYHVVAGEVLARQVVASKTLTTLNGQRIDIQVDDETGTVTVDGAKVTTTDIKTSNGVIHVLDSVILPASANIVETAAEAGSFETLLTAARAAGLVEALTGDGPLTVFAPTDAAFAKLPEGTVESLLKPENKDRLAQILLYHVVEGRVYADQAVTLDRAPTLAGSAAPIEVGEDGVTIAGAKIVATDIEASNGVIHVIDSVMLPSADVESSTGTRGTGY